MAFFHPGLTGSPSSESDGQTPILIRRGKQKSRFFKESAFAEKQFTVRLSMLYLHGI
ncbi:predicted protein [Neisseria gonorrhoeae PID1]|nr:predicted protein [Neisseria gonorrhoeae PID18]EEZ52526.1 predicted protein [Neisseria gonorrhoeae PID1]EEZ54874.1 predicted protein [Neisseria gonorrhoeae PID332]